MNIIPPVVSPETLTFRLWIIREIFLRMMWAGISVKFYFFKLYGKIRE
jgi:hypothetical protein